MSVIPAQAGIHCHHEEAPHRGGGPRRVVGIYPDLV
jgi:hypothetical protein